MRIAVLISTVVLIASGLSVLAADSYRVNSGAYREITEHGQCRAVTNSKTRDLFVPTKTFAEFSSFYNSNPTNVTIATCPGCGELSPETTPQYSNIVFYAKFDGSGSIGHAASVPSQINGDNATTRNANGTGLSYTTGKINGGIQFDGVDDGIGYPNRPGLQDLTAGTFAGWVYLDRYPGTIYYKSDNNSTAGWWVDTGSGFGNLGLSVVYGTTNLKRYTNNVPALSTWFHMLITWDGTTTATGSKIFINGAEVSAYSTTVNGAGVHDSDLYERLDIGTEYPGAADFLQGRLDNLVVWNIALTPAEAATFYTQQSSCP